ncbi:MAG: adenosylhomocysteinase, partial [Bdellovibrionia bacterium]
MPILSRALNLLPDLTGVRLACSMHLEIKMVPLIEGLLNKGAKVFLTTCNPGTVRDEVIEYLKTRGAEAYAWRDMSEEEQSQSFKAALNWGPTHLCEMGADLSS